MILAQKNSSALLWGIIGVIVVLLGGYIVYAQFFANDAAQQHSPEMQMQKTVSAPPATPAQVAPSVTAAASEPATLVDESLLKAPVAEDATLAKDEIAKLDDVQKQLQEQESTLTQQHKSADELIQLKEEQIKLLEAQLAQQTNK